MGEDLCESFEHNAHHVQISYGFQFFLCTNKFFFSGPFFDGEHEAQRRRIWILCSTVVSVAHVPCRQVSSFVAVLCWEEKKKKLKCYGSSRAPCYLLCSRLQYFGMQLHGSRAHLHTYWISDTVYMCANGILLLALDFVLRLPLNLVCVNIFCVLCMYAYLRIPYVCDAVSSLHQYHLASSASTLANRKLCRIVP